MLLEIGVAEVYDFLEKRRTNLKGMSILLITATIWGVAFTAQAAGAEHLGGFSYTAIRFVLGVLLLLPTIFIFERKASDKLKLKKTVLTGFCCGLIMFTATAAQQFGIQLSGNSGKAGFITSLYILIVPILGLFMKRFPGINTWLGVVCGIFGMYLLTVKESIGVEFGDLLVMCSAFFWALHILSIDKFAADVYALRFSIVQFTTVALTSGIFMFIFEDVSLSAVRSAWLPIAYDGFGSVGIAYTLQIIGQKYTEPVPASLVLSLESVFAAIAGAIILNERMDVKGYIGCILIFAGIILAQLPSKYFEIKKRK